MILLTVVCSAAVLASSVWLFDRMLYDEALERIRHAAASAEHELDAYRAASHMAAVIVAENPEVIQAVKNNDHDEALLAAQKLPAAAQVDFCTILDSEGNVLARTHEPDNFGGSLRYQSNVSHALDGEIMTAVERGTSVLLSVRTGAPIFDEFGNVIGAASLGYRFDTPGFVDTLSSITGCEVALFLGYERISSTFGDSNGIHTTGTIATGKTAEIIEHVLSGGTFTGRTVIRSRDVIASYNPIYGHDDEIVGVLALASYADDDTGRLKAFIIRGIVICLVIVAIAVLAAVLIANTIDRRTNSMLERIRESEKLELALEQAENASKAKSEFMANMSHEVRTPLNAILGITEMRLRDDTLSVDTRKNLEQVFDSGKLLLNIVSDILDHSKIEAGVLEIRPGEYNVPSLICDSAQLNRLRYDSKPIGFRLNVDPATPLTLIGDEMRLKQILNNLLSNAFKYTDEGEIRLIVYYDDTNLVFEVIDTGKGMTEEQLGQLFHEYTRFNPESNRTSDGVGLGLKITKQLTELMGGTINVTSKPGAGSTFTVSIPQKRKDSLVCGERVVKRLSELRYKREVASVGRVTYVQMPHGRVLLVDDVKSNLFVTKSMLRPYGLQIDTADSGFDAIEMVKAGNTYDIIFMDHMMPKMDGIETTKRLRAMGYDRCIIALSANALVGQEELFMLNGFDGYISKPIDSRELNRVLLEHIGESLEDE